MRGRTTKSIVPAAPPLIQGDLGSLGHPKARSFTSQSLASTGSSHWNATWTKRWDQEAEELALGCVLAARAALQPWGSLHTHPKQHQLWAAITIPCGYQAPALWCYISHLFWQSVNFLPSPNCLCWVCKSRCIFWWLFLSKSSKTWLSPSIPRKSNHAVSLAHTSQGIRWAFRVPTQPLATMPWQFWFVCLFVFFCHRYVFLSASAFICRRRF